MSLTKDQILIQNIIKCSADLLISSAEIDLLISELFTNFEQEPQSIGDIKNAVLQKYELLQGAYDRPRSEYDVIKEKLLISKYVSECFESYTNLEQAISHKPQAVSIAYWYSNIYAQEASDAFADLFDSCDKIQADSFVSVCESISDENVLGVIPIANSNDGRLMSFYRLIDKFDLKISAIHNVENPNGDGFSRFALVGKKLYDLGSSGNKSIEFSVVGNLISIVCITEFVGGTVKEITSIPSPHKNNDCLNYITASISDNNLHMLWWFLYLFSGDVEFIGFYSEN